MNENDTGIEMTQEVKEKFGNVIEEDEVYLFSNNMSRENVISSEDPNKIQQSVLINDSNDNNEGNISINECSGQEVDMGEFKETLNYGSVMKNSNIFYKSNNDNQNKRGAIKSNITKNEYYTENNKTILQINEDYTNKTSDNKEKRVNFLEHENEKCNEVCAFSEESNIVWEMVPESKGCCLETTHENKRENLEIHNKIKIDLQNDHRDAVSNKKENIINENENVWSLKTSEQSKSFLESLENRRNEKPLSILKLPTNGPVSTGKVSTHGVLPSHECGSLFVQCGSAKHESLVQIFSDQRARGNKYYHEDYTGPVSLTEILEERHQDRVMGNLPSFNKTYQGTSKVGVINKEAEDWEKKASTLNNQVQCLQRDLHKREQEILRLEREVHKLKSVLHQATNFSKDGDILSLLHEVHGMAGQNTRITNKKQGVSGESSQTNKTASEVQVKRYEKDFSSKQLIKAAIMDNDFLKNLDQSQVRELVESMYPQKFEKGSYVIREGEAGSHLYVAAEGEFEVIKDNIVIGKIGPGKAFGELAILYNCTRTASIKVIRDSKVWVLDRRIFQRIMMETGIQRILDNINFLRSVPLLHHLSDDILTKISDVLEVEFYTAGHHIIRQGTSGDTFFILSQGSVKVTQILQGSSEEQDIRVLKRGDYFGEQALLKEDCRTASVIALPPGVECLTLDRESFIQLIGDLSELQEKDYGDFTRLEVDRLTINNNSILSEPEQDLAQINLDNLDIIATLGIGGFGRVELVQSLHDKSQIFALKCLKKQHIVETHQQEHVYSEKAIMMSSRHPFICRLYKTFKDSKYVYMLLEACLGGEVWTILRDRGCFDDSTACFITACVIEALSYLHSMEIVFRDLKPENLLLDSQGFVKLVDFGFAKRLGINSSKTWTFCGTPEYVAPEVILNRGHDKAVDCWALGILIHELLTGAPPFSGTDPMKVYNMILKGIDMVDFPRHVSRTAQQLIKKLCRDLPAERLGCQKGGLSDIRKNKWFQGFDWDGLRQRKLTPPIVPQIRSSTDTTNFDQYPKEIYIPEDETSDWDADF